MFLSQETWAHVKGLQGGQLYSEIEVGHERGGRSTLPHHSSTGEACFWVVTAQEFNDTKKDGPYGEPFFFLMRRIPMEAVRPRHVSTECFFSFAGRKASGGQGLMARKIQLRSKV